MSKNQTSLNRDYVLHINVSFKGWKSPLIAYFLPKITLKACITSGNLKRLKTTGKCRMATNFSWWIRSNF